MIRKTGKVHGADWHGKIVTFLLYGTVAVHIIWFHITPMVSDLLIGLCAIMMVVSVVLYIIKNTRTVPYRCMCTWSGQTYPVPDD